MKSSDYVSGGCLTFAVAALFFLNGCVSVYQKAPDSCLSNLGSPISKFCEVTQKVLWRGAKPDNDGAAWLIEHDVRTIVNLEFLHDDLPAMSHAGITNPGTFEIEYFRVKDWEPLPALAPSVEDGHVVHFLAIASQQARQPVYVHCRSGQNRTGVMVAAYKIIIEGSTNIGAVIEEMKSYEGFWSDIDAKYILGLSVRRNEILQKVKDRIPSLEKPTQIICKNGKCKLDLLPSAPPDRQ